VIDALLLPELFLVDVAETAWNLEIEERLAEDIRSFIG